MRVCVRLRLLARIARQSICAPNHSVNHSVPPRAQHVVLLLRKAITSVFPRTPARVRALKEAESHIAARQLEEHGRRRLGAGGARPIAV